MDDLLNATYGHLKSCCCSVVVQHSITILNCPEFGPSEFQLHVGTSEGVLLGLDIHDVLGDNYC